MPKGDFENRDRDELGLGDLTDDLGIERGELDRFAPVRKRGPADMRNIGAKQDDVGGTPLGAPVMDYTVRSIYDSRPPSAVDFNEWFTTEGASSSDVLFRKCVIVPQGYVGVLRKVSIKAAPSVNAGASQYFVAVCLNGAIVIPLQTVDAPSGATHAPGVGITAPETFDTWIIADENQTFGVSIVAATTQPDNLVIDVGFYGNYLLKTGVPALFQPANLGDSTAPPKVVPSSEINGAVERIRRRAKIPYKNVPLLNARPPRR